MPTVDAAATHDFSKEIKNLSAILYTSEKDLPKQVELVEFPAGLDAARVRFTGGVTGDMLSNIWVANLAQMNTKFDPATGYFRETGKTCPWYGGYSGIGTWAPIGIYAEGAFSRTSDHYATLALRCLNNPQRWSNYVDFCDKRLYFYRTDHDPKNGPDSAALDDADPQAIKIMPRVAAPMTGIEVSNFITVIPAENGTGIARVSYQYALGNSFKLQSDKPLENLAVRLGPYDEQTALRLKHALAVPAGAEKSIVKSGHMNKKDASWVWVKGMKQVSNLDLGLE